MEGASLSGQVTEIVEGHYDIGKVTTVYEIFGGYTNRSFGIKTASHGCEKTYFVRQYKHGITDGEIGFEHALIRHAIENGFSLGADVVVNTRGETFVQAANSYKFAVYEYLSGEDRYSWDNPDLTDAEFKSAARVLADFHNAVRDFDPGGLQRKEPPILTLWRQLADKLAWLAQQKPGSEVHVFYTAHLDSILDMIARNPLDSGEAGGVPLLPIHCDYHPGNLKWTDDQVTGIFDLDWSKMDLRLFDVALAVIYFCSRWDDGCGGELRLDKCILFLGAYQHRLRKLAGLKPIMPAEQKMLPKMLEIANVYLIHWEVSFFMGSAGADDREYLVYLQHNVGLMYWLERHRSAIVKTIAGALS
jgi:homoserine kinase type II